jgi:hypothetical protein
VIQCIHFIQKVETVIDAAAASSATLEVAVAQKMSTQPLKLEVSEIMS